MDKDKLQKEISKIVHSYVEKRNHLILSIGVLNKGETATFLYTGSDVSPVDEDNPPIYEIGSTSKVFTTTLLGEMIQDGILSLNDSIGQYIPKLSDQHPITLKHLANHTSGLPDVSLRKFIANLFKSKKARDPYCLMSVNEVLQYYYKHPKEPKLKSSYSNEGMGTLGRILAKRLNTDYEQAIKKRIAEPLGMKDTFIKVPIEKQNRLLKGHDGKGKEQPPVEMNEFAGAGAIRSTINDMLLFLKAHMNAETKAYQLTQQPSVKVAKNASMGLGWILEGETIWHNGNTLGFSSHLEFEKKRHIGAVILSNYRMSLFSSNPSLMAKDILQLLRTI
ncbi:serine hydrolase domain-containing protein [Bacillus sp. JJ1562]|uniref:serine hydrolase domain-containing protein n=1 Tax=Bacillus sp. JJ1562 TaxID=3122960 RepID=UPI0030015145